MKKINLILSVFLFLIVLSCKKDEQSVVLPVDDLTPELKQWAFMGEVTATDCGICGYDGYNNFNLMKKNNSSRIVALAVHCNYPTDSMVCYNMYSTYCNSRPTGGGIPSFHIGDIKTGYSVMQPYIDTLIKRSPEAQLKFTSKIEGNKMNVTSKIKFFKNVTGDYYVSYYLCENGIDGGPTATVGYKQSGGSSGYKHNNVVRALNSTSAYGVKITTATSTPLNTMYDYSCSIDIAPNWVKSNLFVTAVIWKKNPDNAAVCKFLFVNGWDAQVYH